MEKGTARAGARGHLVTVQPGTGNGRLALALALQLSSSEKYFMLKPFSWFFEMGLVT